MQREHVLWKQVIAKLLLIPVLAAFCGIALAEKGPKTYPEEGKIIGVGTKAYVGGGGTHSALFPSYKVETGTKMFELLCGSRGGCGGDKKLQIGDVIHFRLDQYHGTRCAYVEAPKGSDLIREDRLLILSEELKPDAKSAN
jgi:hypothetical protein